MPSPAGVIPTIDLQTETTILAYHTGVDGAQAEGTQQRPKIGAREVVAEVEFDFWNALVLGVI